MRAALLEQVGKPLKVTRRAEKPSPENDEVLVKISASGVCWADLAFARGYWKRRLQMIQASGIKILGHEGVGKVVELGRHSGGVLSLGQRVGVPLINSTCEVCDQCLSGYEMKCERRIGTGEQVDGTFAGYATIHERYAILIPDQVDDRDAAPLMDAGVTAYSAVKRLRAEGLAVRRSVSIIGAAGGVGHYAVQIAKNFGYKVVAVDIGEDKVRFTEKLGADIALDAQDAERQIRSRIGKVGAAIVCTNSIKGFELAFKTLAKTGPMIVVGAPSEEEGYIPITPEALIGLGSKVIPVSVGTRLDQRELLALAAEGRVRTHLELHDLAEINEVLERIDAGKVRGRSVLTI